jgi:hypothetical protein
MPVFEGESGSLKRCVFVGPSLSRTDCDTRITRFGPAQLGSVYLAAKSGYQIIGLVDGIFGNVPSVWHKEVLFALDQGCVVAGSSSIGALRAAELDVFGMRGIGLCYRLYKAGVLTDDDEVAVLHADASMGYARLSEPMINVRCTLRKLRRRGLLNPDQETEAVTRFKALHFSERTFAAFKQTALSAFGEREGNRIQALFHTHYRDIKMQDARRLVEYVLRSSVIQRRSAFLLRTGNWRHQFEKLESELRPLQ